MQRTFFLTSLLGGLALAGTIYFGLFDQLSETMLVQLSGLWFLPFVFGLYGLLGRMVLKQSPEKVAAGGAVAGTAAAVIIRVVARAIPPIFSLGLILLIVLVGLPLFFIKNKHPLIMASVGVGMWAPLLIVFLLFIFPSL